MLRVSTRMLNEQSEWRPRTTLTHCGSSTVVKLSAVAICPRSGHALPLDMQTTRKRRLMPRQFLITYS
ncbi:uncharacterized protein SEPMUDRAFT_148362 [Sphaerulina musiva SO2202]|uniref:Uncharacterized protein n=1 Tax=Sphaerulina musiva (strain SO2202) TaxID=692275 RepID=M3D9C8_SPHMS|nr:uncharacterized protein SEPMUDRAFT_148362 [Sphaerulina musiva SO2202]EMF14735.1 hypothetical protein SEPMUDRAFT_148362 [Sphaerulina musiva SO2202]